MQREHEHAAPRSRAKTTRPLRLAKGSDHLPRLASREKVIGSTTQMDPSELRALVEQTGRVVRPEPERHDLARSLRDAGLGFVLALAVIALAYWAVYPR